MGNFVASFLPYLNLVESEEYLLYECIGIWNRMGVDFTLLASCFLKL